MLVNLNQIARFSKCPRFFRFMENVIIPSPDKRISIATLAIKKAYNIATESGHLADHRRVMGWVDTEVFRKIDIEDQEAFSRARVSSEQILTFIQSWREAFYSVELIGGYTDIISEVPMKDGCMVKDILPIIIPSDVPIVIYIDDVETTDAKMYNDIRARGLGWMLSKSLSCPETIVRHLCFKPRGGFGLNEIFINKDSNDRIEESILELVGSIRFNIDYPSVTEQCLNCAFKRRCKL